MTTREAKCLTSPACWAAPAFLQGGAGWRTGPLLLHTGFLQLWAGAALQRCEGFSLWWPLVYRALAPGAGSMVGAQGLLALWNVGSSQTIGGRILNHSPGKSPYQHIRSQLYSLSCLQSIVSALYLSITHALTRRFFVVLVIFGTALGTKQALRKLSINTCSDTCGPHEPAGR